MLGIVVSRGSEGVDLVDEDEGGRLGGRLLEDGAQPRLRLAQVLGEDLGAVDGEELGLGFGRDRAGNQSLTATRWAEEEKTSWRGKAELRELRRGGREKREEVPFCRFEAA